MQKLPHMISPIPIHTNNNSNQTKKTKMKKATILVGLILASAITFGQPKLVRNANGDYIMQKVVITNQDSLTGKKVISTDGNEYPIYISKNGKYYIKRVSKAGNEYKQYLKLEK